MLRHSRLALLTAMAIISLLSVGCGRKPAALNGTWKVDTDKQMAAVKDQEMFKKLPDAAKAKMEEGMKSGLSAMSFTFADGKLTVQTPGGKAEDAEYKVASTDGDKWQLEATDKSKKTVTMALTWTGNDSITLTPPKTEGSPMEVDFYLVRQK